MYILSHQEEELCFMESEINWLYNFCLTVSFQIIEDLLQSRKEQYSFRLVVYNAFNRWHMHIRI
jgi:hypothetical protein